MHKLVKVNLTSIFSPICQALINENSIIQEITPSTSALKDCVELLVIRLQGTVIAFCSFTVVEGYRLQVNSIHYRKANKDHELAAYWLSRSLQKYLSNKIYLQFLLDK